MYNNNGKFICSKNLTEHGYNYTIFKHSLCKTRLESSSYILSCVQKIAYNDIKLTWRSNRLVLQVSIHHFIPHVRLASVSSGLCASLTFFGTGKPSSIRQTIIAIIRDEKYSSDWLAGVHCF